MDKNVRYTDAFITSAKQFISECEAKRKEILDACKDTVEDTTLPDIDALADDAVFMGADEDGLCYNCWGVTDNYESDYPFVCKLSEEDGIITLDAA